MPSQRNIEFSKDVTFDEDVALGKARDTPPRANVGRRDHDLVIQEDSLIHEPYVVDDPMQPIHLLDPLSCDPLARKRHIWLCDTLQDVERHVAARGTFRKSKNPC